MAKINTTNYQPVAAWNGTQDLLIVEQPDGTKVATPEQVKQYVEAGDFEATGEIKDGHGNTLKDMAKSADVITVNAVSGQSSSSKVRYVKFGKMVIMSGFVSGGSTYLQSGTKVFEGLPKPVFFTEIFAVQSAGNGYKRFALNTNGEIYCYNALNVTNDINFYVCYVCA